MRKLILIPLMILLYPLSVSPRPKIRPGRIFKSYRRYKANRILRTPVWRFRSNSKSVSYVPKLITAPMSVRFKYNMIKMKYKIETFLKNRMKPGKLKDKLRELEKIDLHKMYKMRRRFDNRQ